MDYQLMMLMTIVFLGGFISGYLTKQQEDDSDRRIR